MTCYKDGGCGAYEMYSCSECPASKPKYLDRKKPRTKDDYKTIFIITVFEATEDGTKLGSYRSPCFRPTFELAEEVVKTNMCDIWETCYDYAIIQEIGSELYPYPMMQKYYKYNRDINGYEPIEKPKCLEHSHICGIG